MADYKCMECNRLGQHDGRCEYCESDERPVEWNGETAALGLRDVRNELVAAHHKFKEEMHKTPEYLNNRGPGPVEGTKVLKELERLIENCEQAEEFLDQL